MFKQFEAEGHSRGWGAYVVDQRWAQFSTDDHETWDILQRRQTALLQGRIVSPFLGGLEALEFSAPVIPHLDQLNERLAPLSGWRCVAVAGLVPDAAFFAMLAERVFPVGNFIRRRAQLDYLEEPDCFHDIYGHVPMLAHRPIADAMQCFAAAGVAAIARGEGDRVARMYWHTIEFGLCREEGAVRVLGAGLASSFGEVGRSLDDLTVERRRFTPASAEATPYRHDAMQPLYLVADDLACVIDALAGFDG